MYCCGLGQQQEWLPPSILSTKIPLTKIIILPCRTWGLLVYLRYCVHKQIKCSKILFCYILLHSEFYITIFCVNIVFIFICCNSLSFHNCKTFYLIFHLVTYSTFGVSVCTTYTKSNSSYCMCKPSW